MRETLVLTLVSEKGETLGDLRVREARSDELEDLQLSLGELGQIRAR
jgi:hypothetical protein